MKRLKKWFMKLDDVWVMLLGLVFFVFASITITDASVRSFCTLTGIPIYLFLLQNVMLKKQENNYFNIDLFLKENIENEIVWKLRTDNSQDEKVYLSIKNTGEINIFSSYIKILKNDGAIGWFQVPEMLNVNKECVVCVPYKKESIREIVVTCSIQTESKTKKYNGLQSGKQNITIFSNVEMYEAEKYAIYHERGFDVFDKMERFWI
jgi:hypothetical protein